MSITRLDHFDLRSSAILLDVDGTILDIAPTMHEVYVPVSLRQTLAKLSEGTGGALALVSGRPLRDLDILFAPSRFPAIGGHGAEMRISSTDEKYIRWPESLDRELKQRLRGIAVKYSGVLIEDKGYSLALHYRMTPKHEVNVVKDVFNLFKLYDPNKFEILMGKAVIEVKAVNFDKGTAVRELLKHPPFADRVPIFVGDDITDEAAFAVMPEFNGLAISVGRKVFGINGTFETPKEMRRWLERISNDIMPTR